ncbi:MAG TPA: methyltransferase [Hyphomicrobium sp.]|nr:methyltransferase [Hyphomicrobium sp.]
MADGVEVEIARIGARGDGVAMRGGAPVYVPFALPGERWRLDGDDRATRVADGAARAEPICRHFLRCGGCVAQHMPGDVYRDWKRGLVVEAFRHRGIEADVAPVVVVAAESRRRAVLGVVRRGGEVALGFREEGQHKLVDLAECPVLEPAIVAAFPALRTLARRVLKEGETGRLVVTRLDHGLDVSLDAERRDFSADERAELARLAREAGLLRLTIGREPIVSAGPPAVTIGGVAIAVEPSVFLQAVPDAERVIADLCVTALPKRTKTVVDLFSGVGTLTFPLARRAQVSAFDSDKRAVAALSDAVRHAQGLKPVTARVRDLFSEPLSARELNGFDAAVFDPPRAGAADQAARLAASKVPVVIAVSCNPATLARDARALIDGGYTMGQVTPVDQFLYSAHVEAVAVFRR